MSHLPPAYRGAPYHQPRRPPRRLRALRILLYAVIGIVILLLVIITGASLAHGGIP
ncbi:MAG TPA: hypothetical protein VK162_12155 [Streptosporangiaceae bacterium]|nr:hypothetical protein [Streptosporangiaceae bacterium]